ncbi:MAG: site-2 protease family protein [Xanthobacteraceae bacterium]|jgi:membrane-associated protease RseP (regulator of RpoE activity)
MYNLELFMLWAALLWSTLLVHELGHLLTARYFGVRVLALSVGIGPELLGITDRLGTRWSLRLIPARSYIKADEIATDRCKSNRWEASIVIVPLNAQRALIYAAGPAANLLLAPVMFVLGEFYFTGALAWPSVSNPDSAMALIFGLYGLSVGLLNLLPLPRLDGGKLMRLGVEWSRRRNIHCPRFSAYGTKSSALGQPRRNASDLSMPRVGDDPLPR